MKNVMSNASSRDIQSLIVLMKCDNVMSLTMLHLYNQVFFYWIPNQV